jgi:pyruvate/2-oxoglutarate dehydrogenase complex dihydrolipoamide acyltransferase (E2) component
MNVVGRRHRHSPLIRRLAAEYDVDPDRLTGSGPGGRVTRRDVLDAVRGAGGTAERTSPLLSLITRRLVESLRVSAQLTRVVEADVTGVAALPEALARAAEQVREDHPLVQPLTLTTVDTGEALFELPVLRPPHVAVLSAGTPAQRPVVRDGAVVVRRVAMLALGYDQRAVEPAEAARFLSAVRAALERLSA